MYVGAFACDAESHPQLPFFAIHGGRVSQLNTELAAITSLSIQLVLENSRWATTPTQHLHGFGEFELHFSCLQHKVFNLLATSPALRGFFVCLFVAFLFIFNHASPNSTTFFKYVCAKVSFQNYRPSQYILSLTMPGSFLGVSETLQASRDCSMPRSPLCHEGVTANSEAGWDPRSRSAESLPG